MRRNHVIRNTALAVAAVLLVASGAVLWRDRQDIADTLTRWQTGPLPPERTREELAPPVTGTSPSLPAVGPSEEEVEKMRASQPTSPPPPDPAKPPAQMNLKVPMVYQAPFGVWDPLHEDACEEASILMARYYLAGRDTVSKEEMDEEIRRVVDFEMKEFGYFESTTAEQTAAVMREFFGLDGAVVLPLDSVDAIKRQIAAGRPVILPTNGKLLGNPNFRNGGPLYHMLVVKGYTSTGKFITNDPGTRKGADYVYDQEVLFDAIGDWNGHDRANGPKVMIVVE